MKNQEEKNKSGEKKKPGPKKKIKSPEILLQYFLEYVQYAKSNPFEQKDWVGKDAIEVTRKKERALTMVGFETYCFLNGYINDLKDYFSNDDGRYTEYQPTCRIILVMIEKDLAEGALAGVHNGNLAARIMGYTDKSEAKITTNVNSINLDNLTKEELNKLLDIQNKLNVKG